MAIAIKTNRIDIRLTDEDKEMIEKAAYTNRQSLSSYIISVVIKQAQLDLLQNETIHLCNEDRDYLLSVLDNPPEPTQALKDLFKW